MNKTITSVSIASLLAMSSLFASATETTSPPTAIPGVNQPQAESNEEKANKKGEEASGSNSGADAQSLEKDADSSSGSREGQKTQ